MGCPSLLYASGQTYRAPFAADAVFTDLMLRDTLRDSVIRILQKGAAPAEITARQEIFRLFEADPAAAEAFAALSDCAAVLSRLLRRYDALTGDAGAPMVFTHLAGEFLHFLDLAVLPAASGTLLGGFIAYTESLRTHPQIAALRDACAAAPLWSGRTLRLRTVDASLQMNRAADIPWEQAFEADLAAMGLPPSPPKQRSPRQMPPAFTAGLSRLSGADYEAARSLHDRFAPFLFSEETDIRSLPALSDEIGFYSSVHAFTEEMRAAGYPMTLPALSPRREIRLTAVRDISLRHRDLRGEDVVPNDVHLTADGGDHFFWLTGANGGGKTVYLRSAGIALVLALNGCPVPCEGGCFGHFERLMTHFPLNEDFRDTGRFDEEKRRADDIAAAASPAVIALLNETFSGTDEAKSAAASRTLAQTLYENGAFGIYVTHLHELTGGEIPTLAAVIDETDGNRRTYRIVRQRRTDCSHAADILYKYALTRQQLAERRRRLGKE